MKKKILLAMGIGAGALIWYKMKNPDMMDDMKKTVKNAAQNVVDFMD